jgi:hypothetical protein
VREEKKGKAIELAESARSDYEQAIRRRLTVEVSWNYDLMSNQGGEGRKEGTMIGALMPKPGRVVIILGRGGKGKGQDGEEGDGRKGLGLKDLGGKKNDKTKSKPSPARPG